MNDGQSLPMVADSSIDLAFSFDSLVHVEDDVMPSYLDELARVLSEDGVAFGTIRPSPDASPVRCRHGRRSRRRRESGLATPAASTSGAARR